jgi:shikimate kinase/3-dehydroquinate synthase
MTIGLRSSGEASEETDKDRRADAIVAALGRRAIVLVGLMGSGKTSIGRRLAQRLGLEFVDSDAEIERAADMSIPEIFSRYGEAYFRDGERRVMARLLESGPRVIATGGGAFMNEDTRIRIAQNGLSVWLKADIDVLWRRVRKRTHRPLLQNAAPEATLRDLMQQRYPIYAHADVTITSRDEPHTAVVQDALIAIECHLANQSANQSGSDLAIDSASDLNGRFEHSLEHTLERSTQVLPGLTAASGDGEFDVSAQTKLFERVGVDLGARSYDILIGDGLIGEIGDHMRQIAPGAACAVVTDENVAACHLASLEASLQAAGIKYSTMVVPAGESSKSFSVFEKLCESILAARLERGDLIIALGGGVVGDLVGFVAASVRRGMRFIQIPTSLLAQVDSSVGGKTGINSPFGKNLIGAFHQPCLVLADTRALATLPLREFRAGYAEVVKYGLIDDPDFFAWLENNHRDVFAGGAARVHAIARSCAAKATVVAADENEQGERALLNLGHTFGHALERLVQYDSARLVHGEGVAIGMACAFRFSAREGFCSVADAERVQSHLRDVGLPVHIRDIPGWDMRADAILEAMYQDKKVERGGLTFILARGIGASFIAKNVDAGKVLAFLQDELH